MTSWYKFVDKLSYHQLNIRDSEEVTYKTVIFMMRTSVHADMGFPNASGTYRHSMTI